MSNPHSYWQTVEAAHRAARDPSVIDAVADAVADAVNETNVSGGVHGFTFYVGPAISPEDAARFNRPVTVEMDWNAGGLTGTVCLCFNGSQWQRTAGRCLSPLGFPPPPLLLSILAEMAASACAVLDDATATFKP